MKIFGWRVIHESEYEALKSASDAVRAELFRLWDVEREYKRLTDRDEKGRFVKGEFCEG